MSPNNNDNNSNYINNELGGDSISGSRSVHSLQSMGGLSAKSERKHKRSSHNNNDNNNNNNNNYNDNNNSVSPSSPHQQGMMMTSPGALMGSPGGGRFIDSPERLSITETLR